MLATDADRAGADVDATGGKLERADAVAAWGSIDAVRLAVHAGRRVARTGSSDDSRVCSGEGFCGDGRDVEVWRTGAAAAEGRTGAGFWAGETVTSRSSSESLSWITAGTAFALPLLRVPIPIARDVAEGSQCGDL